jgi:serine/threonine protein kinase
MKNEDVPPTDLYSKQEGALDQNSSVLQSIATSALPTIPNYRIEKCVGAGGFGKVYRAVRVSDELVVAIKMMHTAGNDSSDFRQRFLREATVLCKLDHPRIVTFRELGMVEDSLYLVMDFVNSVSWGEIARERSLKQRIAIGVGIIDHCLDALIYAHSQGIVHRDIKPSNILLEKRSGKLHVRLADFGLAKSYLQAGHSGMTSDQQIAGTLCYLAPELINGIKFFKPASDQYSVAASLYGMLADRPPIVIMPGRNPLLEIRRHSVPRIEEFVPNVSSELAAWIHRGLQSKPEDRFDSTQEMRDALQAISSSQERKR